MTSTAESVAAGELRYHGAQHGVVVDNQDPDGRYRVRVTVPGLIEKSAWAYPFGTMGGGSAQRGGWVVPDVGADVVVFFIGGDPDFPIYAPAWWGKPKAGSEMPINARDVPAKEAYKVQCFQIGRVVITFDEREGKRLFSIEDTKTGDQFVWDLETAGISITTTSAILLKTLGVIDLKGTVININGRKVLADSKPI